MNNANANSTRHAAAAASPIRHDHAAAGRGPGLPPEVLGLRLADLKRQLALRQAMP